MALPGDEGAFNLEISYRGSCDMGDDITVRNAYGQRSTVRVARKFTDFARPANVFNLIEWPKGGCFRYDTLARFYEFVAEKPEEFSSISKYSGALRHGGSVNYLMLDGHIKRMRPEQAGEVARKWNRFLDVGDSVNKYGG